MFYQNVLIIYCTMFVFGTTAAEPSKFRILAPEIVCPKDENSPIDKPDNTVITLQTEVTNLKFEWKVRWVPLDAPTQWFTLMLWKTVRMLETHLNGPQLEPLNYVINNTDLLKGVDYVFNVTSIEAPLNGTTKTFHIDNIKGDQKLIVDGRADKFSVYLVGADNIYADMEYVLKAEVTTCSPDNDYYFVWKVESEHGDRINVSHIKGERLTIPPYTLHAGSVYYVNCLIYKNSTYLVTQTDLPFEVLYRGLKVYMNVDSLQVSANTAFYLDTYVDNRDYYNEEPTFTWQCTHKEEACKEFNNVDEGLLELPAGLSDEGMYIISVEVNIKDQKASTNATIYIVQAILPVIQIQPLPHSVNNNSLISMVVNASNVAPSCTLTWYYATKQYLLTIDANYTGDGDYQHGVPITDTVTVYSLEENFLNELTDYTNTTEWRQVTADLRVQGGRARFVAQCGCSLTFNCETQGVVYGDISFDVNEPPVVGQFKISPKTGTAMETIFRISKPPASDIDKPLLYKLFCSLGHSDTIVFSSNLQHLAVDIFLPYVGPNGTTVWMEVCDSFGACASTREKTVLLAPGEGRTVDALVTMMKGIIARCEVLLLNRLVKTSLVTYINAEQSEPLGVFKKELMLSLPSRDVEHCLKNNEDYITLLNWLGLRGVDTSSLTD